MIQSGYESGIMDQFVDDEVMNTSGRGSGFSPLSDADQPEAEPMQMTIEEMNDDAFPASTQVLSDAIDGEETTAEQSGDIVVAAVEVSQPSVSHQDNGNEDADREVNEHNDTDEKMQTKESVEETVRESSPTVINTVETNENPIEDDENTSTVEKFEAVFGSIWKLMLDQGWQVAEGPGTMFCAMPDTQFFNFRPNINVFDSKDKACWKYLELALKHEDQSSEKINNQVLWDSLWPICEKKLSWHTMACGSETWFVQPKTRFEDFQPNVTIFQTKRLAILKSLANENIVIELGESVEGPQSIDFNTVYLDKYAPASTKKQDPSKSKSNGVETPVTTKKSPKQGKPASIMNFVTPVKQSVKVASSSSSGGGKRPITTSGVKVTPPSSTKKVSAKKTTPTGKSSSTKKKKKAMATPSPSDYKPKRKDEELNFHIPEFRCTFGLVYEKLQTMGWYHRSGKFEYDYFSPDYTEQTAILNGNYFQSAAELEEFIKACGLWQTIESQLRDEHAELVEELRQEAIEKRRRMKERMEKRQQENREAKQKALEAAKAEAAVAKAEATKAKAERLKAIEAAKAAKLESSIAKKKSNGNKKFGATAFTRMESAFTPQIKISMGKIVKKLIERGWYFKPGRFEYDYFKPGVTPKNARPGEDYFQSEAELETHLKVTGLWNELAQEICDEQFHKEEQAVIRMSQEDHAMASGSSSTTSGASSSVNRKRASLSDDKSPVMASSSPTKRPRSNSKDRPSPAIAVSTKSPPRKSELIQPVNDKDVTALTDEIWVNSTDVFEFDG